MKDEYSIVTCLRFFIIALFFVLSANANANNERANEEYNLGHKSYFQGDWRKAAKHLCNSYREEKHSLSAIMCAGALHELGDAKGTHNYVHKAFQTEPPLDPEVEDWANRLLASADLALDKEASYLEETTVEQRAKIDDPGITMSKVNSAAPKKNSLLRFQSSTKVVKNRQLVPLKSYWSAQRGDNITCGTAACRKAQENSGGYRYIRVEGCAFKIRKKNTIPLVLYWHSKRKDNSTVASTQSRAEQVKTGGYRLVRTEAYIYKYKQPGTIPLKLYWYPKRTDNATVAAARSIAAQEKTKGMSYIRTEGYIYPASNCKG